MLSISIRVTPPLEDGAMETIRDFDLGGYWVTFTPASHNGSKFVELTVIGKDERFLR